MHAIAAELVVHFLESTNEIEHLPARIRTACGSTKVRAASEGTAFVNQAAALRIEHRAGAILALGQFGAPGRTESTGGHERLTRGQ